MSILHTRMKDLVKRLNEYRDSYYNHNISLVSDEKYDNLYNDLLKLENKLGIVLSNSPTQTVGCDVKSVLQKAHHSTTLKSLNKTKSLNELNTWLNKQSALLMLKADGLTVELVYDNGEFIQGITRGNGEIGEDITHTVKTFKNVPMKIPYQGKLRISGEAIIHWNDFHRINEGLDEKYSTPRNLVSGSVRQLNSQECAKRQVYFYLFNILEYNNLNNSKSYNFENIITNLGFDVIPYKYINKDITDEDISEIVGETKEIPIDGLVLTFDSIEYSLKQGETSHHPLHSLAYKFKDESETTTLRDIEWSVGRMGTITPVAIFDTVLLDNTEVSRASLHNISIFKSFELGIGDQLDITKSNMIIPQVQSNKTRSNTCIIPEVCPVCGYKTEIVQLNESKELVCGNMNCSAQIVRRFTHFVSRDCMNIEGLSSATLEKFVDKGWLETYIDIYHLSDYEKEIIRMEGFGKKSYQNLIESIEKSKTVSLQSFILSLGINNIGLGGSKRLAEHFITIENFLNHCLIKEDLVKIKDIGEITAQSIVNYFKENLSIVQELLKIVNVQPFLQKDIGKIESILSGKKVYPTGIFTLKKDELKKKLEEVGCEVTSGYSKSLDYLICGDTSKSGKVDKAKKDGVSIMTEEECMLILNT